MGEVNSYEELRRKQVEENKRKLEEFGLHHLSAAVREASAKPKPLVCQIDAAPHSSFFFLGHPLSSL
jgi:hypothetical protein